ncbi:MAG: DNA polymerase III subunit delta', partial [Planctomycetaceae bacterium]
LFRSDIALRPMAGMRRVAVIDDADYLNAESANAFLKTLEEPPPGSVLILIATNIDAQLPTIRSRCQPVRFGPLPVADVAALLLEQELAPSREEAESAAQLSDGSLTNAVRLLDPKLRTLREVVYQGLASEPYRGADLAARVLAALEEIGGDAPEQRQLAVWVVRFVAEFFDSALRTLVDAEQKGQRANIRSLASRMELDPELPLEVLADLVDRAAETEEQIAAFTSVPQCLEGLFLAVGQLLRSATTK